MHDDWRRGQQFPSITIDFGKVNKPLVLTISFIIALIIGYFNQTDLYNKLNKLPQDRNELTPIKSLHAEIVNGSTLYAKVGVDAISEITFDNLFRNLRVNITGDGLTLSVSAASADTSNRLEHGFEFTSLLPVNGRVTLQFCLFNAPINDPVEAQSEIRNIYINMSLFWIREDEYHLSNVCIKGKNLTTHFVQNDATVLTSAWPYETHNVATESVGTKLEGDSRLGIQRTLYRTNWELVKELICPMAKDEMKQNFLFANTYIPYADLFNATYLGSNSELCFAELHLPKPNVVVDLEALRERLLTLEGETSDVLVLDSTITNVDSLCESLCPNCSVKKFEYKKPSEIAEIAKRAKYVIGSHGNSFIGTLNMIDGTAVEVVRSPYCITDELLEIHRLRRQRTIVYVLSEEKQRCDMGQYSVNIDRIQEAAGVNTSSNCEPNLVIASEKGVSQWCQQKLERI